MAVEDNRCESVLVHSWSRRAALQTGGLLAALGSLLPRQTMAAQATPTTAAEGGVLLVQSFGTGYLAPTQGDAGGLPYTLILWDAADRGFVFVDRASGAAGVIPTETVLTAMETASEQPRAVLVAAPTEDNGASASQEVWALRLGYGSLGSDPGAVTYQGGPLDADESAAWLGTPPAALPDGPINLGAGYVIVAAPPGFDAAGNAAVLLDPP